MLTFLVVLVVLYFTGLLPFVFGFVALIADFLFSLCVLALGFIVFIISVILPPYKSK